MFTSLLVAILLLQPSGTPPQSVGSKGPRALQAKLQAPVQDYAINAENFLQALTEVATEFQIPMGIEWSRSPETLRKVSRSWTHANIQQVIEELVKDQPGYEYEISNGVVHVFPQWTKSSQQDFTKLKIGKFEVRSMVVEIANHRLRDLIRLRISPPEPLQAHRGGEIYSQATNVGDPDITVKLEDVSVQAVLDSLALASDRKIWVVTFNSDSGVTPAGFWRTRTLWNNSAIPDNEQPVWDMFRWGDVIPHAD